MRLKPVERVLTRYMLARSEKISEVLQDHGVGVVLADRTGTFLARSGYRVTSWVPRGSEKSYEIDLRSRLIDADVPHANVIAEQVIMYGSEKIVETGHAWYAKLLNRMVGGYFFV